MYMHLTVLFHKEFCEKSAKKVLGERLYTNKRIKLVLAMTLLKRTMIS